MKIGMAVQNMAKVGNYMLKKRVFSDAVRCDTILSAVN